MKLIEIQKNVISGQCKGALLRIQIRYIAIFIGSGMFKGWAGSHIGVLSPVQTKNGYVCNGFYFEPWFAPDIPVCKLPRCYTLMMKLFSFRIPFKKHHEC